MRAHKDKNFQPLRQYELAEIAGFILNGLDEIESEDALNVFDELSTLFWQMIIDNEYMVFEEFQARYESKAEQYRPEFTRSQRNL